MVQALLNQKVNLHPAGVIMSELSPSVVTSLLCKQDLREECIKLKMLVFDLERQNRALCELFQQKLPNQPTAHYQVPVSRMIDTSSTFIHCLLLIRHLLSFFHCFAAC